MSGHKKVEPWEESEVFSTILNLIVFTTAIY